MQAREALHGSGQRAPGRALAQELTEAGRYAALHSSCEAGEAWGEDLEAAERAVASAIANATLDDLPLELRPPARLEADAGQLLATWLEAWARACPRPLVLVFDEIDALRGASLLTVLRQLRAGYPSRPRAFPSSVILCGLRDVRDYKAASGGDPGRLGTSSPFNIKVESIKLGNFDEAEERTCFERATTASGRAITVLRA